MGKLWPRNASTVYGVERNHQHDDGCVPLDRSMQSYEQPGLYKNCTSNMIVYPGGTFTDCSVDADFIDSYLKFQFRTMPVGSTSPFVFDRILFFPSRAAKRTAQGYETRTGRTFSSFWAADKKGK